MNDNLPVYELGYLMLPTVGVADVSEEVSKIVGEITSRDGEIVSSGSPEVIFLKYDINKTVSNKNLTFSSAYFGWIRFRVSPDRVREIRDAVDANRVILRSLLIKLPKEALLEKTSKISKGKMTEDEVVDDTEDVANVDDNDKDEGNNDKTEE